MANIKTDISKYKTKPYKHQLECINKFCRSESFACLADMGTGKTWIMINNLADLWASDDCSSALILAPNGVHSNWSRLEFPKHMPDWVRYKVITWIASPNKKEKEEIKNMYKCSEPNTLLILMMNHEALQTKRGFEFAKQFCETSRKLMIIVDEADAFKNPSAGRTKSLMRLKPFSSWRRIMTGTLINNAPFDAFAPFSFLDESILGTDSFYAFKAEYAEMLRDNNPLIEAIKKKIKTDEHRKL